MKPILFIILFFILQFCSAQKSPFYIKVKNNGFDLNFTSAVVFATEVNDDEIIYLQNYIKYDEGQPLPKPEIKSYLIKCDKDGEIEKEIYLRNDSLKLLQLFGIRDRDKIIVFGSASSEDSCYIISRTYDLALNLISESLKTLSYKSNKQWLGFDMPIFNWFKDNLNICLSSTYPLFKCLMFQYDENSILVNHNINRPVNQEGTTILAASLTNDGDEIILLGIFKRQYYDLDLNLLREVWYDSFEPTDSAFYPTPKYIPIGNNNFLAFGSRDVFENGVHRTARVLGIANERMRVYEEKYVSEFAEGEYSDGPPRYTSGLFKGTDGYYTCYEAIPEGEPIKTANTFFIAKFDFEYNLVWDRRFIMEEGARFFNLYAELTNDNEFIISGWHSIFEPILDYPYSVEGHIIGLSPEGFPSTLSNSETDLKAFFSVQENPVRNNFIVNKSANNNQNYTIHIADIKGNKLSQNNSWVDGTLSLDVQNYIPGTYIYTILKDGKLIFTGKFIKI